ncbi:unnamed protein product, partial [Rotaria magnacalcarata]
MKELTINNERCLLAHGYGQESQGPQHQPPQKKKKCHGNRKLQRFRRKCRTRGTEEKSSVMLPKMAAVKIHSDQREENDDEMNVFSVSKSNSMVELPLSNHNQNARQIHEHNETSLMGNVNTNSIPLTSSSRKQTYHQIPNIKMNSTTNKSSIPIDKWKTSYQLIPNYLKMSSRLFVDLLFPIEIIWLSNIPKDTTRINSINWAYPRTIENLNKRQTIIQNKLKEIQHQLMIHVNQESFIARPSISKSIDLINLIDTAIREFVHQGQQRLRTMYGEQKLIFEFDHNDLRLVKSLYSLNPTNEQLLHVQKLWRSKVKACKRAIQQCHDNSSLHDQPNTEINT